MNKKIFVPLVLAALSLSGCSTAQTPTPATQVAQVPAGCPATSSVTAQTGDLKNTTFTPVSAWFNVYSGTPGDGQIVLSTYNIPKGNTYVSHDYTASDALVVVKLSDTVTNKVGVGNYSKATDAKMKVGEVNVSSKNLSGGVFDENGSLEITYLTDTVACGTMKFDDGSNKLNGSFMAQVNKS